MATSVSYENEFENRFEKLITSQQISGGESYYKVFEENGLIKISDLRLENYIK